MLYLAELTQKKSRERGKFIETKLFNKVVHTRTIRRNFIYQ